MDEPSNSIPDLGTGTLAPKRIDSTLEPLAPESSSGTTKPRFTTSVDQNSLPTAPSPWENVPGGAPPVSQNAAAEPVLPPPPPTPAVNNTVASTKIAAEPSVAPAPAPPTPAAPLIQPSPTPVPPAPPIAPTAPVPNVPAPVIPPLPPKLARAVPEVFYVPEANSPTNQTPVPAASGLPANSNPSSANIPPAPPIQNPPPTRSKPSRRFGFKTHVFLAVIVVLLLLGGAAAASVKIFVLDRVTKIDLLPEDTRFFLSIAVKNNPEAKALKDLVKKFPSGEKVIESFDKQLTSSLSSSDDPFASFLQMDKTDLFLTQISTPKTNGDYSSLSYNNLISISNLLTPTKANEELNKIENNSKNVVEKTKYGGEEILNIHLKENETSARPDYCSDPEFKSEDYCKPQKPPTVYASAIKQFIAAGPKEADIKKISDLEKIKASFGLQNPKKLKTLESNPDYRAISKQLPSKSFLKFYSNLPVSPYTSFLPATSIQQSIFGISSYSLTNGDSSSNDNNSKTLTSAISVTTSSNEFQIDSYELDKTKTKNSDLKNPFSLADSLATQIPTTLNGVTPAFYGETRNIRAQIEDQFEQLRDLSKNSDSKKQRDAFSESLKSWEESKKTYKESVNLDFDTEVLPLFEGQSSVIFNAGAAKIAPELLILSEIKDEAKAEASLKKITIPDYSQVTYNYETGERTGPTGTLSPQPTAYNGTNIYSLKIYTYMDLTINLYFAVTNKKVIFAVSTTDKSIKELIDFETKPTSTLLKTSKWQAQLGSIKGKIGGFVYIEPIQFWGLYEYIKSTMPEYTDNYVTADIETAVKAYLETLQSIATVVTKKKPVYRTSTAVRIVELSASKKMAAEEAVNRLTKGYDTQGADSVLGASTNDLGSFFSNLFH